MADKLDVILCWHMHQPQYRSPLTGRYHQPWAYLHAIKDYCDMAWHLEQVPAARAVVNLTPILVEQLDDYCAQFAAGEHRDPILRALATMDFGTSQERRELVESLFRSNQERVIDRFAPYAALQASYNAAASTGKPDFSDQYIADLLVWYHLAWFGESVRQHHPVVGELAQKGEAFTAEDRLKVLALIEETIRGIVPRYRRLAERGQVELSTSPYAHPMMPLLIDLRCALEAMPDAPLPRAPKYPGGAERVRVHLEAAKRYHVDNFGVAARGCWPSEGGISDAAAAMLAQAGFAWTATGEGVLSHTLGAQNDTPAARHAYLYRPYDIHTAGGRIACFFRDDQLSDKIGFVYSTWHADDATNNLLVDLEHIREQTAEQESPVVSIILDGENAWEHYPENARYFLRALYEKLATHPHLRMTTFSDHLKANPPVSQLDHIVAGSWVYGTLSTWIGNPDKNLGWDELIDAKRTYDEMVPNIEPALANRIEAHLRACEGSDWFWWFGDYNPAQSVREFDVLYRAHLHDLYAMLGKPAPALLERVISEGHGDPAHGGTMRRTS
ncbi:MAG TPA: glycoside hydrolase family 57 protein [Candidatus Tumulicola sp.]|nr:glycoside hydrolase family 57 protein [Candidatus Tumulicola sp.]